jgi:AbrB family looped-hinge helix DNA binding protein
MVEPWYRRAMETTIDAAGRIVVPKALREALGLVPGTRLDVTVYGSGLQIVPTGRTARLVEEDGVLVATGDADLDDETVFALIESFRR